MMYYSGPDLGVGISYMSAIGQQILNNIEDFDFIEAYTERFFIREQNSKLKEILKHKPVVLHGLDLSLGSPEPVDRTYFDKLEQVINETPCHWYSDHISLTKIEQIEVGHLMPISFEDQNIETIVSKVQKLNQTIKKPFLLENITYYYQIPSSNMKEYEFISRILNEAECGMLLDLNNLYLNSLNHNYDPYEFLKNIPIERIVEIHLAGGSFKENMHVDTHANAIANEVWKLFEYAARTIPFRGVIIERDANFEPFSGIVDEARRAKSIIKKYKQPAKVLL
ncbi:multinuclear nonheme iron-dependent oxidase [Legionella clemsonensis]|uniref:DUF692 domain-containing protein n=1 Tax=Legionella clemsonensis TaxID=1867846 RepID=A0A222P5C5_9GAMM|nr:DUF692 family multinuclear iron-containing protein [Legionella clemsonensis]ASQ47054.1 hypothetical protein clem_12595 [Legionella clemsonensis]